MNLIAQQALARALVSGARPVPVAEVLPPDPVPAAQPQPAGKGDRLSYLEGRRHAADIVCDSRALLEVTGGAKPLLDRLRQCMQCKPASFARGVAEIIELVEREVGHG